VQWSEHVQPEDNEAQLSLLGNAAAMGISEDGNIDEEDHHHSDDEMHDFGQNEPCSHNVYVSVMNPRGEPAFKPSKTKPLPKWMSLLPSNVQKEREQQSQLSVSEACSYMHELQTMGDSATSERKDKSPSNKSVPSSDDTTPKALSRSSTFPSDPIDADPKKPAKRVRTISIDSKPTKEYSIRNIDRKVRSPTNESVYMTPPGHPPMHPPARKRTPYPGAHLSRAQTETSLEESSSPEDVSPTIPPGQDPCYRLQAPTPLSSAESSKFPTAPFPSPVVFNSSEYIDRYQPTSPESTHQKFVARNPELIIEKIKRQKVGNQNMAQVSSEGVRKRHESDGRIVRREDEGYGLDPRREDLNRELRNLFCEE